MQEGIGVQKLAEKLQEYEDRKNDFIAPTSLVEYKAEGDVIEVKDTGVFKVSSLAHTQMAGRLKIPKPYYNRMMDEAPDLLERNINHWLHRAPEKRLFRTFVNGDNVLRAILSDKFRISMSNSIVARAALPVLMGLEEEVIITSCHLTDRRLYIQARYPKVEGVVGVGDIVQAGIAIRNSEVGLGKFVVELLIWVLRCGNGMILSDSISKYHVGRRLESEDDEVTKDFYKQDTIEAEESAFYLRVRDTVSQAFNEAAFQKGLEVMNRAAGDKFEAKDTEEVVKNVTKRLTLSKGEGKDILAALIEDGDLSRWGVGNAITRMAHKVESYDRAYEYEQMGGQVMNMGRREWDALIPN